MLYNKILLVLQSHEIFFLVKFIFFGINMHLFFAVIILMILVVIVAIMVIVIIWFGWFILWAIGVGTYWASITNLFLKNKLISSFWTFNLQWGIWNAGFEILCVLKMEYGIWNLVVARKSPHIISISRKPSPDIN